MIRTGGEASVSRAGIGLAACGVLITVAAAGCSVSASKVSASKPPAWAKALGPGVTVTDSGAATAGDGSPAGVILREMKDLKDGGLADFCSIVQPSGQAACRSGIKSLTASELKSAVPVVMNIIPSYTAVDGDKALVGYTGSICAHDSTKNCVTNTDPAAIFDSGKSFAVLWKHATAAGNSNSTAYALGQLVKIKGTWYEYSGGSSGGSPDVSASPTVNADGTVSVNAPIGRFPVPPGSQVQDLLSCPKSINIDLRHVTAPAAKDFYLAKLPHDGYKITDTIGLPMFFDFTGHGYKGSITMDSEATLVQLNTPGTPDTYVCPF